MFEKESALLKEFADTSFFSSVEFSCFDTIEKDSSENHHIIMGNGKHRIQIIFCINPSGVLVGNRTEEGYETTVLGNEKHLTDSVLYDNNSPVGILRLKKEKQYYLDSFENNLDYSHKILSKKRTSFCKGEKLYGENIDEVISLIFAENLTNNEFSSDKQIYFTVWNSSISGENGLVSAVRHANPDQILFLSLVDIKEFTPNSGPAFVFKDGNYVLPLEQKSCIKQWAKEVDVPFDGFVGKTNKSMELLDIHSFGKQLLGVYLPVHQFDTAIKEVFWSDVEKTRNILLKYITTL